MKLVVERTKTMVGPGLSPVGYPVWLYKRSRAHPLGLRHADRRRLRGSQCRLSVAHSQCAFRRQTQLLFCAGADESESIPALRGGSRESARRSCTRIWRLRGTRISFSPWLSFLFSTPSKAEIDPITWPPPCTPMPLFCPDSTGRLPGRLTRRARWAVDIYNQSLTQAAKSADGAYALPMGGTFKLPFGELTVTFNETDLIWAGYRMKDFIPAADVEVRGLRNRYRTPGVGPAPALAASNRAARGRPEQTGRVPSTPN